MISISGAFVSLVGILFLVGMVWLFKDYQNDRYRQDLFDIRTELFEYAKRGEISFGDTAYGLIRSTINGNIRFAHRVSFFQMLAFYYFSPELNKAPGVVRYNEILEKSLGKLEPEQKKFMEEIYLKMHVYMLVHMVKRSIFLIVLLRFLSLFVVVRDKLAIVSGRFRGGFESLDEAAWASVESARIGHKIY